MIVQMEVRIQSMVGMRRLTLLVAALAIWASSLATGCAARTDASTHELERLRRRVVELEEARHRDSERLEDVATRLVAVEARPAKGRPDLPIVRVRSSDIERSPRDDVETESDVDAEPADDDGPRPVLKLYESRTRLSHSSSQGFGSTGSRRPRKSIQLASVNERLPVVPIPDMPGTPPLDTTPAALSINRNGAATAPTPAAVESLQAVEEVVATARSQVRSGNCGPALQSLAQVLSRSPEHPLAPEAMMLRAKCYRRQGAPLRAIGELERLARRYPNSGRRLDALLEMAEAFVSLGDTDRARDIYRQIIRRYPRSRAASRATARVQELGRGQRAREE
jgi:TolA-binding protein